ncbi:MAG: CheR family methyltransferase [Mariprofundus sp.]
MTATEAVPHANSRVKITGSDISEKSIATAKAGIYKQMEIQRGLPIQELITFFKQVDEHTWQVSDQLKAMIHFQEANLISPALVTNLRAFSPFDIVFCRNVLIYFDLEQRKEVIDHIAQLMNPGGYLFTGAGEMVEGKRSSWKTERIENRPVWRLLAKQ